MKKIGTNLIPDLFRANTKFRSFILYLVNKIKPAQVLRPEQAKSSTRTTSQPRHYWYSVPTDRSCYGHLRVCEEL